VGGPPSVAERKAVHGAGGALEAREARARYQIPHADVMVNRAREECGRARENCAILGVALCVHAHDRASVPKHRAGPLVLRGRQSMHTQCARIATRDDDASRERQDRLDELMSS
jgi:hypothetical protein